MEKNVLQKSFTLNDNDKDFKTKTYQYVCALLNSGGGTLRLNTKKTTDKIIRPIEQRFQNLITTLGITNKLSRISSDTCDQIILEVKGHDALCTMNYNLYLPTETQVMLVCSLEVSTVKEILNIHRIVGVTETDKSVPTTFIFGRDIGIKESKTVQFKNLKSNKLGSTDLASRLKNNKLTQYVSAFANHCGGRLYCGVRDDGIVEGQKVMDEEKEDLIKKVSECINEMIWPDYCGEPQRGRWDISFEPVTDDEGNPIRLTFVIVIFVAACQGGVFCSEPESYHIVDDTAKKMKFAEWKRRFFYPITERDTKIVPTVSRICWSSPKLRLHCDKLDGELLREVNNGKWDKFNRHLAELQKGDNTSVEERLVVLSKRYLFHYRKSQYEEAKNCLTDFDVLLSKTENTTIFDIRRSLILSAMERSRGNHKESYEIAKDCLFKVEQLAPSILTAEFYVHFATMLTIIESNKNLKDLLKKDLPIRYDFKYEALLFYNKALEHLEGAGYVLESKTDMQQKSFIKMAILRLGCSLSGDVVDDLVTEEDIKEAVACLKKASNLEIDSGSMNGFRSCQHSFAKSSLSYRRSQAQKSLKKRNDILDHAIDEAEEAEARANKHHFDELSRYARQHARVFNLFKNGTR